MGLAACQAHLISAYFTVSSRSQGLLLPGVAGLSAGGRPQSFWLFTDVDASAVGDIIVEWAGRS